MRTLQVIQDEVKSCTKCELHKTRTNTVFSRGNPESYITILGEAGGEEDKLGIPFVGRSGQLLNKILTELGLDIEKDIYVANVIKCRPPNNRRPSDEEVNHCIGYLEEQISIVKPKVIIALGNTAVGSLINTTLGITKLRGKFLKYKGILVMPTYHPSFLLRNGSPDSEPRVQFKQDVQLVIDKIKELDGAVPLIETENK